MNAHGGNGLPSIIPLPDVHGFDASQVWSDPEDLGTFRPESAWFDFSHLRVTGLDQATFTCYDLHQTTVSFPEATLRGRFRLFERHPEHVPVSTCSGSFTTRFQFTSGTLSYRIHFLPYKLSLDVTQITLGSGMVSSLVDPDDWRPSAALREVLDAIARAPKMQDLLEKQANAFLNERFILSILDQTIERHLRENPELVERLRLEEERSQPVKRRWKRYRYG